MEEKSALLLPLFDGSNFAPWKFRMTVLLEEHELLECVRTDVADVPELQERSGDTHAQKDAKVEALKKRIKKEYIHDKESPKDIWDALHRERRSIASRMHLKRQMLSMRFEGGNPRRKE